ncbi:unnamed protein product, partial [Bubo scandiacus]
PGRFPSSRELVCSSNSHVCLSVCPLLAWAACYLRPHPFPQSPAKQRERGKKQPRKCKVESDPLPI